MAFLIALIVLTALAPLRALALEIDYPDFIPLENIETLPELISALFTFLLVIAGIAAFITLLVSGFQFIISGASPKLRAAALRRLRGFGLGLLIVLTSAILLQTINPQILTLPLIGRAEVPYIQPPSLFPTLGELIPGEARPYRPLELGQALQDTGVVIANVNSGLLTLIGQAKTLTAQCSARLCRAPVLNYSQTVTRRCTITIINDEGKKEDIQQDCPQCQPATCVGKAVPNADPLNNRAQTLSAFDSVSLSLNALKSALSAVEAANAAVRRCNQNTTKTFLSCAAAKGLSEEITCTPSEDFFCAQSTGERTTFERINLPVQNLVRAMNTLSNNIAIFVNGVHGASCSRVEFRCGANTQCQPAGVSAMGSEDRGCPADLFDKIAQLEALQAQLANSAETLDGVRQNINQFTDSSGRDSIDQQRLLLCEEAQAKASRRQADGKYPANISCGPDENALEDIKSCLITDFYLCR